MGVLAGEDLHDLPVLELVGEGDDAAVDLGPHHVVAHLGVDVVGEVHGGRPLGQVDDAALGGEDEDPAAEEVLGHRLHELPGAGELLLPLLDALQPGDPPLDLLGVGEPLLIEPVGGDAVLGHAVHLPGADLHLQGQATRGDHRGVEALVAVGLGHGDVVLDPAGDGLPEGVDQAEDVVADLLLP